MNFSNLKIFHILFVLKLFLIVISCLSIVVLAIAPSSSTIGVPRIEMENWASTFGSPLNTFVQSVSKYVELHGRFDNSRDSNIRKLDPENALDRIMASVQDLLNEKVEALRKITFWAEERAKDFALHGRAPAHFNYVISKRVNDETQRVSKPKTKLINCTAPGFGTWDCSLNLKMHRHFSTSVNLSVSTVHVPGTIFEQDPMFVKTVNWTSDLDEWFKRNYQAHPRLHFQYFCAETGLMRQYPGIKWPFGASLNKEEDVAKPDIYDCRMRPWYIGASSSRKTILILIDSSGSMTGLRYKIATHVAFTILETLTDNDKMAVFNFTDVMKPIVPCFKRSFKEATPENVRSVKQALREDHSLNESVNYKAVLGKAFDMFKDQPDSCNKAIFLITDGAPSNFEEVIKARKSETNSLRIFTYLVGREATDAVNLQHMACNNNGWFSHLSALSQVQEEVLKYIPVMSRPMVFSPSVDVRWSPVYANQVVQPHIIPATTTSKDGFEYMISASLSAHETHDDANSSKPGTKVEFLGVAGTDIPLRALHIATNPFSLGTNGYAFATTNNGHLVFHPRWTPHVPVVPTSEFNEHQILKPNYQAMDFGEVEMVDDEAEQLWRNNDTVLLQMREEMLFNQRGRKAGLNIKIPQENFRRVTVRKQNYEYAHVPKTPYTLAIAVEQGMNQFVARFDLAEAVIPLERILPLQNDDGTIKSNDVVQSVNDGWILHPKWLYCEYLQEPDNFAEILKSREVELVSILQYLMQDKVTWKNLTDGYFGPLYKNSAGDAKKQDVFRCNKELVESLVFDANATNVFTSKWLWNFGDKEKGLITRYGVVKAFLTTRSGLTRWIEVAEQDDSGVEGNSTKRPEQKLSEMMGLDSIYYRRAIDQYPIDSKSFVYTISATNPNSVIASRPVFISQDGLSAPAAVIGLEFNQRKLAARFFDVANVCLLTDKRGCKYRCSSSEFDCFVLDDNGYVVISENEADNGKFFGDINVVAMKGLIKAKIYREIRYVDYQSICFTQRASKRKGEGDSAANLFRNPFTNTNAIWNWFSTNFALFVFNFFDGIFGQGNFTEDDNNEPVLDKKAEDVRDDESPFDYNKILLCDMHYKMFKYGSAYNTENFSHNEDLPDCGHNCVSSYSTHFIPNTNLILVITDGTCTCYSSATIDSDPFQMKGSATYYENNCPPRLNYSTRHPDQCIDLNSPTNKEKDSRQECGRASNVNLLSINLIILSLFALTFLLKEKTIILLTH